MTLHHLTFSTSRDGCCPTCNASLATNTWTIRGGVALCVSCAVTLTLGQFAHLKSLITEHGQADFATSHGVTFFTPPPHFPKTVVWHLWILSPANVIARELQPLDDDPTSDDDG